MAERICPNCWKEVAVGRRFCGGCGLAIGGSAQSESTTRFCIHCGTASIPGKRFCKECGKPIGSAAPAVVEEPAPIVQAVPEPSETLVWEEKPEPAVSVNISSELPELRCGHCGAVYSPGKRFCKQCGKPIGSAAPAVVEEPAPVAQDEPKPAPEKTSVSEEKAEPAAPAIAVPEQTIELVCGHCGAASRPGKRFCKECGKPLNAAAPAVADEPATVVRDVPAAPVKAPVMEEKSEQVVPVIAIAEPPKPAGLVCGHCGAECSPGKRFCKQCGKPIGATAPAEAIEPPAVVQDVPAIEPQDQRASEEKSSQEVGTAAPATADEQTTIQQDEPVPVREETAVFEEMPEPAVASIAIPEPPEPAELRCAHCGAVCGPGKRFCKQCGEPIGATAPAEAIELPAVVRDVPEPEKISVSGSESAGASIPPPEIATSDRALLPAVGSAASEILPKTRPPAEAATGVDEDSGRNSAESPSLPLPNEELRHAFRSSDAEQEAPVRPQFEAGAEAHDSEDMNPGGEASLDRDEEDSQSNARRRRTLLQAIGGVSAAAVLGVAVFITTSSHWRHRLDGIAVQPAASAVAAPAPGGQPAKPAQSSIPVQTTKVAQPTAQARPSTLSQPPKPVGATMTHAPMAPAMRKPSPQRQEVKQQAAPASSTAAKTSVAPKTNAKTPPPKEPGGSCALESGMISKMLDRADTNREQGHYPDAARQYRSVLECDHNNARARNGLDLTMLSIQHQ